MYFPQSSAPDFTCQDFAWLKVLSRGSESKKQFCGCLEALPVLEAVCLLIRPLVPFLFLLAIGDHQAPRLIRPIFRSTGIVDDQDVVKSVLLLKGCSSMMKRDESV